MKNLIKKSLRHVRQRAASSSDRTQIANAEQIRVFIIRYSLFVATNTCILKFRRYSLFANRDMQKTCEYLVNYSVFGIRSCDDHEQRILANRRQYSQVFGIRVLNSRKIKKQIWSWVTICEKSKNKSGHGSQFDP